MTSPASAPDASSLWCRLRDSCDSTLVGLGVIGSARSEVAAGCTALVPGQDLDLLLVTVEAASQQRCQSLLGDFANTPVDAIAISFNDLQSRLFAGDTQIISLLADALFVRAERRLVELQQVAADANFRSDAREIERLLNAAATLANSATGRREQVAAVNAATQAVLLSLGLQPRGTQFMREVLPQLAIRNLAPPGYLELLRSPSLGSFDDVIESRLKKWVSDCAVQALSHLAVSVRPELSTGLPALKGFVLDVGGTLLRESGGQVRCTKDTADAIARLASIYPVVALTNGDDRVIERLHSSGLANCLAQVICSSNALVVKPSIGAFELAAEALSALPEEIGMIGDSLQADIVGGWRAGMRAYWISPAAGQRSQLRPWGGIGTDLASLVREIFM